MLLRLRWMAVGLVLAVWVGTTLMTRLARQHISSETVGRAAARAAADGLARAAEGLRGAAHP